MTRCPRILVEKRQNFGALGTVLGSFFGPLTDLFRCFDANFGQMIGLAKGLKLGHDTDNVGMLVEFEEGGA